MYVTDLFSIHFLESPPAKAIALAIAGRFMSFTFISFGLLSGMVLLLPIPNRIVKHPSADDSNSARDCENKSRPEDISGKLLHEERIKRILTGKVVQ